MIGRTVGGAYLIQELIGVGGMGRVYRGIQNALGRTVAIKVVHPHLLGDEQTVARFYNEARAASRLNHPASVGVIDFGRTEEGNLYLVMEFLSGKDQMCIRDRAGRAHRALPPDWQSQLGAPHPPSPRFARGCARGP